MTRRTVRTARPTLTGELVVLEPLWTEHLDELVVAVSEHRPHDRLHQVPSTTDESSGTSSRCANRSGCMPFAQRRVADGRVVGCTAYFQPIWWRGRFEPDEVEIGGSWLDRTAQRTASTPSRSCCSSPTPSSTGRCGGCRYDRRTQRRQSPVDRTSRRDLRGSPSQPPAVASPRRVRASRATRRSTRSSTESGRR